MAGSLLSLSVPAVAYARPLDKAQCRPDQMLTGGTGDEPFSSADVLSQTFTLRVPTRVCMLRLLLRRNVSRAQAGPVVLTLLAGDQATAPASVALTTHTIAEDAIGAVTFSFGCDGSDLPPALTYTLQLSSPDSASGAYTRVSENSWGSEWPGDDSLQVFICQ